MRTPFFGPFGVTRSKNLNDNRLVNFYPELSADGKDVGALFGTPGLVQAFEAGDGPIRGIYNFFNVTLFIVSGEELYYVDALTDSPALLGTIEGFDRVSMVANQDDKLFIVAAPKAYIYDLLTSTLSEVSLTAMGGTCDYIQSFFIFEQASTGFFYVYDGVTFDPLDFAGAQSAPDHLIAVLQDHNEAWLFGDLSTEVWAFTGDGDFPLQPIPGAAIPQGCAAKFTPVRLDNSVFWLGRNEYGHGIVWRANGYSPIRVSTHAVETAIAGYSDISDAFAWTYEQEGHSFYVLTFPTGNATWVYDVSTNMWHERASYNSVTQELGRHRANCGTFFQGEIVVGDFQNAKLYTLDLDVAHDGNYGPVVTLSPDMNTTSTTDNYQLAASSGFAAIPGYFRLERLTVEGGIFTRPAQVMVANDTVGGAGNVSALAIIDAGDYTVLPDNPVSVSGGSGDGLTFNAYWTQNDQSVIAVESGAGFTAVPTITFTPTGATATGKLQLIFATPAGGTGYVVGDTLTLSGGTSTTTAQVKVAAVNGSGAPTALAIARCGVYSVRPTGFITLTGGTGTGATCTAIWGQGTPVLTSGGTEYTENPTIVVSGNGVGASLNCLVDATTNYIKRVRSWRALPTGVNNFKRTMQHTLTLDCESGVGVEIGPGQDPQVMLKWSDDGGHTWSNEHWRSMGRVGQYGKRVYWRRLGSTEKLRDRVYQIEMTSPVKAAFIGADIELSGANS